MSLMLTSGTWLEEFGRAFIEKLGEEFNIPAKLGSIGDEINHGILQ